MTIDINTARAYVKADGDDDAQIMLLLASAQSICQDYCNRVFYPDAAAQAADFSLALSDWAVADITSKTLLASTNDAAVIRLIIDHYLEVFGRIKQRTNGRVSNGSVDAAVLLTLGHLYMNREDNIVSGNNAVQLPVGAQRILQPYLWIGDLIAVDTDACGSGS